VSNSRQISNIALIGFMGTGSPPSDASSPTNCVLIFSIPMTHRSAARANPLRPFFADEGEAPFARMKKKIVEELSARRTPSFPPAVVWVQTKPTWRASSSTPL